MWTLCSWDKRMIYLLTFFILSLFIKGSSVLAAPYTSPNYSSESTGRLFARQGAGGWHDSDLSHIQRISAIGDSYSAGIGAGDRLGGPWEFLDKQSDWSCSRYDQAYPHLVATDARLNAPSVDFQFLSCSGARTEDVMNFQVPYLHDQQDAIMLSVGGNDAELTHLLNVCIFMFAVINAEQRLVIDLDRLFYGRGSAFNWAGDYDFGPISRSCQEQIARSADIVESPAFDQKLDMVVNAAKSRLRSRGRVYWTGYAKFFSIETHECDKVTWASWAYKAWDLFRPREYLDMGKRWQLNRLVELVNEKIEAAAERAGDQVIFVDYDDYVGELGGRFCEAGVDESTTESNTRFGLMFYELNTWDPVGITSSPWKRSLGTNTYENTFAGQINMFSLITQELDPEARYAVPHIEDEDSNLFSITSVSENIMEIEAAATNMTEASASNSTSSSNSTGINPPGKGSNSTRFQVPAADTQNMTASSTIGINGIIDLLEAIDEVPNVIPDGYGRIFHPQVLLHRIIANLVIWYMMEANRIDHAGSGLGDPHSPELKTCAPPNPNGPNTGAPYFYARILPLGASIVWGRESSTKNGFRKPLRDALRQDGWKVNMVGSQNNGMMTDSNVEAHSGDRVDQIDLAANNSLQYQPNIIVINGGTNDCNQDWNIPGFGARYGAMLDKLFQRIPGATIVVSTVLAGTTPGIINHRGSVNAQIRQLVNTRRNEGQRVVLADTDLPAGFLTTAHLNADGIHPNDDGHRRLAAIFYRAITDAYAAGLIMAPVDVPGMSDEPGTDGGSSICDKVFGSGASNPTDTQGGSGLDDGTYSHYSEPQGQVWTFGPLRNMNFTFARVTEPFGRHDWIMLNNSNPPDPTNPNPPWSNEGIWDVFPRINNRWGPAGIAINARDKCVPGGVRFADVNADGLDDLICILPNGDTRVSISQGGGVFSGPSTWKTNVGKPRDRVRLGDIDGDGRVDYCVIADNGNISCWRNSGQGDLPNAWQDLGVVFTGKGMGNVDGSRFADINGDGRDDWLWVDDTGRTWTYTNSRGCTKGSITPLWREADNLANGAGWTHGGIGKNVGRDNIHFINWSDSPTAFGGRPRLDYVYVERNGTINNFHVWRNTGSGGTKLKADGDRYCKMMTRSRAAMDYIWVHSTGYMRIYENLGGTFPSAPPYWGPNYQFWSASMYLGYQVDRRDLHLADWDSDGLCDIIYVNPSTGYMDGLWLNKFATTGDLRARNNWQRVANAGPRGSSQPPCTEKRGVAIHDLSVRFADVTGNGRADYLCIEKDGRTWGYLNNAGNTLTYISQIKKTEGKDRANIRYVDVNGDGRDDFLWIDKFTGDASVWYNRGQTASSGSAFTWEAKGAVYQGAMQGLCEQFPDLDGNGRADLHAIDGVNNTATTWFNLCPGESFSTNGDDADTTTSPKLPFAG